MKCNYDKCDCQGSDENDPDGLLAEACHEFDKLWPKYVPFVLTGRLQDLPSYHGQRDFGDRMPQPIGFSWTEDGHKLWTRKARSVETDTDKIVAFTLAWVEKTVDVFIDKRAEAKRYEDELIGAACLHLIERMNAKPELRCPHAWAKSTILRSLSDLFDAFKGELLGASHDTVVRLWKAGTPLETVTTWCDNPPKKPNDIFAQMDAKIERDLALSCCETNNDREFLKLLEAGYSVAELARELGIAPGHLYKGRAAVEAKYREERIKLDEVDIDKPRSSKASEPETTDQISEPRKINGIVLEYEPQAAAGQQLASEWGCSPLSELILY